MSIYEIRVQGSSTIEADNNLVASRATLVEKLNKASCPSELVPESSIFSAEYNLKDENADEELVHFRIKATPDGWNRVLTRAEERVGNLNNYVASYIIAQRVNLTEQQLAAVRTTPTAYHPTRLDNDLSLLRQF